MQEIVRRRQSFFGGLDDQTINEYLVAGSSNVKVWTRVCANLVNQYFRQKLSNPNNKDFSINNLFSIAALSLEGILREYSDPQPPYEELEEPTPLITH